MAPRKLQLSYLLNKVSSEMDSNLDDPDSQHPSPSPLHPLDHVQGPYGSRRGRGSAGSDDSSSRGRKRRGASSSRPPPPSPSRQHDAKPITPQLLDQRYAPVATAASGKYGGVCTQRQAPPSTGRPPIPSMHAPPSPSFGASAAQGSASREKTNQCSQCPRAFKTKSDLTKHTRVVHLRERNFPCHLCDARFAERGYVDVLNS